MPDYTLNAEQLYTYPLDPQRRIYAWDDLFLFACARVINRDGLDPHEDVPLLDVLAVMDEGFAKGTVVPVLTLN